MSAQGAVQENPRPQAEQARGNEARIAAQLCALRKVASAEPSLPAGRDDCEETSRRTRIKPWLHSHTATSCAVQLQQLSRGQSRPAIQPSRSRPAWPSWAGCHAYASTRSPAPGPGCPSAWLSGPRWHARPPRWPAQTRSGPCPWRSRTSAAQLGALPTAIALSEQAPARQ